MFVYGRSVQRSFDDLGTPLAQVTFCVVDLETTGGSPQQCGITEIGAVKIRGGEVLGTFQTMVNPGQAIPPEITILTGITQAMVLPAPRIESVLPTLCEFMEGTVIVGHNVRFDVGFLDAALGRTGRAPLAHPIVDTCALARRLVRDEVPNCKLSTLSSHFRLDHRPSHRALDDALATCDLLHVMLERAASWGVLGLEDLLALPKLVNHPQAAKLALTKHLPRTGGVYLFRGERNEVLYVGKAANLRSRVRSYFSGDDRRKISALLRETLRIDFQSTATTVEAAVLEVRLIHVHSPRYNQQVKRWRSYAYLKLTLAEEFPRLSVVRLPRDDGSLYIGPLPSSAMARLVADAIECAAPLRRCTRRVRRNRQLGDDTGPCSSAQLGVAMCPCNGQLTAAQYAPVVAEVVHALTVNPALLVKRLQDRMLDLAAVERYEEAANVRDRAAALSRSLERQRRLDSVRHAGRVVMELDGGHRIELHNGVLRSLALLPVEAPPMEGPLARDLADELAVVSAWLRDHRGEVRIVSCDGALAFPLEALPSFEPRRSVVGSNRAS
ncbi:MAG: exonuclease, polymerase epsilon subunit family [Acidimicrobiia bacterium]|nr:exonuclease, polymerase epsilon subunit family [Acidimicrobiia bacterium]